ncbi:MAG: polysaccharide biosynthesis C-terminal domain-containing protein, partial [Calditrichaeota bacterium]|nr:polysaccharide biosynthesis C-terminal domain-containing protein [Calditrichota bacterium]
SWAIASRALPLLYGLVFIVFVIPALPVAEFGVYIIIFTTFNYVALLNKSLVLNPMIRFAADPEQFDVMVRSGFRLSFLFYFGSAGIIWLIAPIAAGMLRVSTHDIRLVTLLITAFFFRDFGFFVQQIRYHTAKIFFIEAVFFIGSIVGMLYLIFNCQEFSGRDAIHVNIAAAAGSSLLAIAMGFGGAKLIGAVNTDALKKIGQYGLYTLPVGLSSSFIYGADTLILGVLYNPVVVGVYGGAKRVYHVMSAITQAVGILILPYAARLSAGNRKDDLKALFEKVTVYVWLGLAGCAIVGILLSEKLYNLLGAEYSASAPLLMILLIAAPFEAIFHVSGSILYGIGEVRKVAKVSVGSLIMLLLLLIPGSYFLGLKGAALALCIGLIITGGWMFRIAAHHLDSGLRQALKRLRKNLTRKSRQG